MWGRAEGQHQYAHTKQYTHLDTKIQTCFRGGVLEFHVSATYCKNPFLAHPSRYAGDFYKYTHTYTVSVLSVDVISN